MILPFTMTIAGTVPLAIALFLWLFRKDDFPVKTGMRLLKCSIFFYLLPVQLVCHILPSALLDKFYYRGSHDFTKNPVYHSFENKVQVQVPFTDYVILLPYWLLIFFVVGSVLAIGFLVYQFVRYRQSQNRLLENCRNEILSVSGKPYNVLVSASATAPYAIGFFNSYVVIPESMTNGVSTSMLLEHEITHVKIAMR